MANLNMINQDISRYSIQHIHDMLNCVYFCTVYTLQCNTYLPYVETWLTSVSEVHTEVMSDDSWSDSAHFLSVWKIASLRGKAKCIWTDRSLSVCKGICICLSTISTIKYTVILANAITFKYWACFVLLESFTTICCYAEEQKYRLNPSPPVIKCSNTDK